jgi:copper homeostasis protein
MIAAVKARVAIPVFAIVRPRGGGFVYSDDEVDVMLRDIAIAQQLDVDGLVIGALTRDSTIDLATTRRLVEAAEGTPVTFHRAFDLTPNLDGALNELIGLGISRVLTSGGAPTARDGIATIDALVQQAGDRIVVMAGGGVREENVGEIVARTGVREVHVRGTRVTGTGARGLREGLRLRKALPADEDAWEVTDESRIRAIVAITGEPSP